MQGFGWLVVKTKTLRGLGRTIRRIYFFFLEGRPGLLSRTTQKATSTSRAVSFGKARRASWINTLFGFAAFASLSASWYMSATCSRARSLNRKLGFLVLDMSPSPHMIIKAAWAIIRAGADR